MTLSRNALAAGLTTLLSLAVVGCARDDASQTEMTTDSPVDSASPTTGSSEAQFPTSPVLSGGTGAPADPSAVQPPTEMTQPTGVGGCSDEAVQRFVGQRGDDAIVAEALAASGARDQRTLRPGDAATMDYRPDRLNIMLDADGVIESVRCG